MKYLFPLVVFSIVSLCGCEKSSPVNKQAQSILSVNAQYREAVSNSIVRLPRRVEQISYSRLYSQIRKIRTDDCPEDFRLAWVDFVEAVDERSMIHGSLGDLAELLLSPKAGITAQNQKAQQSSDASVKILRTRTELYKLGIKYGAF